MKTKVFKLTDSNFDTFQAIANVDAGGKVYVHYINAFEVNSLGNDISESIIKSLADMVERWATKQGYAMWAY